MCGIAPPSTTARRGVQAREGAARRVRSGFPARERQERIVRSVLAARRRVNGEVREGPGRIVRRGVGARRKDSGIPGKKALENSIIPNQSSKPNKKKNRHCDLNNLMLCCTIWVVRKKIRHK
jgi:hypothetical protein